MKRWLCIVLLFICALCSAQTTKVRGVVRDADTGESIPFAGIFFKGTTIGLSADIDGKYSLETRDPNVRILVCQILGYDTQEVPVKPGGFTTVNFEMKLSDNLIHGAVVKADNRKIKRLLANIDARRDRNDPQRRRSYSCDVYSRIELDLTNAREQLRGRRFNKEFGFVFDYMDTSTVSGASYVPAMISEAVSRRHHTCDPDHDKETVVANRISGINPDGNILSQFTGSLHLKSNFYAPFINCFDVEFPSPIQNGGLMYYNYYIIDSLQVDGRKTYLVRYHPKGGVSTPSLDGEMKIDAEDFALVSLKAKMKRSGNVNWIRDIVLEAESQRLPDGTWFYKSNYLYADFSVALRDSSKMMSFIGTRRLVYTNLDFSPQDLTGDDGMVTVEKESNYRDEDYWTKARPYELSEKEKNIYEMVDRIKEQPYYKLLYKTADMLVNGYWEEGPVGYGPYHKLVTFNNLEGFRPQIGIHTTKDLSKKFRFTAYVAYGVKDGRFKGGLGYEHIFSKEPTRKLTVTGSYDVFQLGRGTSEFTDANILSSLLGKGNSQKLSPLLHFYAGYENEFNPGFNMKFDIAHNRLYSNGYVPMNLLDGTSLSYITSNEVHTQLRFSKDETVTRGHFIKTYLHTNHPVVTLDFTAGIPGITPISYGFFRPEVSLDWKFRVPPMGMSKIHLNVGTILGKVPYPMLNLFPGNATYILDKSAFSCMDYFEFAADTWAMLMWHHTFGGFFLGKIPLIEHLKLREEFTLKAAWGYLSPRNNPLAEGAAGTMMAFPQGMKTMGNVPYVEVGAGISNILRLLRVDFSWRLTHREGALHNFSVTGGLEFRF